MSYRLHLVLTPLEPGSEQDIISLRNLYPSTPLELVREFAKEAGISVLVYEKHENGEAYTLDYLIEKELSFFAVRALYFVVESEEEAAMLLLRFSHMREMHD